MTVIFLFHLVLVAREDEFCDRLSKNADFSGFTSLHYAALSDDYECLKLLLEAGEILVFIFYDAQQLKGLTINPLSSYI